MDALCIDQAGRQARISMHLGFRVNGHFFFSLQALGVLYITNPRAKCVALRRFFVQSQFLHTTRSAIF